MEVDTPAVIEAFQAALTMRNIRDWDWGEYEICSDAVFGLINIGQIKVVLDKIKSGVDDDFVEAYFLAATHYLYKVDFVPELLAEMSDAKIYLWGLQVLHGIRDRARTALPQLIDWLKDEQVLYRPLVASAIGAIRADASDAIPILAEMLYSEDLVLSMKSAEALGLIGQNALPTIINALDRTNSSSRAALNIVTICWLITAIGYIVEAGGKRVPIQQVLKPWQGHDDVRVNFLVEKVLSEC